MSQVDVGSIFHSDLIFDSYDTLLVPDLIQIIFLHNLLLLILFYFPNFLSVVCYTEVLDYTVVADYFTIVVLHIVVKGYIIVSLETVAHYTVVVL